jgi:hypothetical protein
MKKLILSTIAATTIIASATAASAQVRTERNWFDLGAASSQQGPNAQSPNQNFAPDSVK